MARWFLSGVLEPPCSSVMRFEIEWLAKMLTGNLGNHVEVLPQMFATAKS